MTTQHQFLHDPATENLIKAIDKEIDDETMRVDKVPPMKMTGWTIHHDEGTSFFTMKREWRKENSKEPPESHVVRCQLTTRDVSLDPEQDIRGEHFPFTFQVRKEGQVIDIAMDVIEGEVLAEDVSIYYQEPKDGLDADGLALSSIERNMMYRGPVLDESEEEFLDGLQTWLAEREIDDQFGEFIGQQSVWIEQQEYERWLKELRRFVVA